MALSPIKYAGANRECKEQHRAKALGTFRAVVTEGMEKGEFRALHPALVSEYFLALISGLIESMSLSGDFQPPEKVVPPLMDLFLGGLGKNRP